MTPDAQESAGGIAEAPSWPVVRTVGLDGFLVSFGDHLSEPANRAALAFRAALERSGLPGIEETSTSLVSAFLRFDLMATDHQAIRSGLEGLMADRDWFSAPLPEGRRLWHVPTVFGTDLAPQLEDAAERAGLSVDAAIASLVRDPVRVQTIGFAPGMPYLGELPREWDIPRQKGLTPKVPGGGLCVAIRQLVLFPVATPTGWRHVGQTAMRLFRPEARDPFLLRPGDEVRFVPVTPEQLDNIRDRDPEGGATSEAMS